MKQEFFVIPTVRDLKRFLENASYKSAPGHLFLMNQLLTHLNSSFLLGQKICLGQSPVETITVILKDVNTVRC